MTGVSTITTKGQVTIPQFIRDELRLQPGHRISFTLDRVQNKITARVASRDIVDELYGSLKSKVPYSTRKQERASAMKYVAQRHLLK